MDTVILNAKKRTITGKDVKILREQKIIPAVVYGPSIETQSLEIDFLTFKKVFEEAGRSTLIDLKMDEGNAVKVLVQDIQYDPETDLPIHVDFRQINMKEKVTAEVQIKFIGESPAVKEKGGILVKSVDHLEIQCLPSDLIHEIDVDISKLVDFDTVIHVKDLIIPENITILNNPDEAIVLVDEPRSDAEMEALNEEITVKVPEGAEEEVKEGAEVTDDKSEKGKEKKAEGKEK
ncbi:MAG: 50S ribosomal protein L25 [Patescibacteria group bacterium]|jgi:large subunit ribosomal protein L25